MFQSLTEKLSGAFGKFKNKGKLTEKDVREGMREVKLALLEAEARHVSLSALLYLARKLGKGIKINGLHAFVLRHSAVRRRATGVFLLIEIKIIDSDKNKSFAELGKFFRYFLGCRGLTAA